MKYAFVAQHRTHYPLRLLCRVLAVSVSGLYDYLHRQPRPDPQAGLRAELRTIHAHSRGTYGRPRLVQALRARGHTAGHKRVARLMREEGLRGKLKGRLIPRTTDSRHTRAVAENRLERQFAIDSPVSAWVGDITYLPTRQGWLYLATVIDLRTRQVLGYSMAERMPDDLVNQAFLNAWSASPVGSGVLFHSDRGSQYASSKFAQTLATHGFVASMSRKGNCWDTQFRILPERRTDLTHAGIGRVALALTCRSGSGVPQALPGQRSGRKFLCYTQKRRSYWCV